MGLIPTIPLSLQELAVYYRIALRESEFISKQLNEGLALLDARQKPSALVSVIFNNYEGYYLAFLEHLKWRLSHICIDESLEFKDSGNIKKIHDHEYTASGMGHPIDVEEIEPMLNSIKYVQIHLKSLISEIEASMLKSVFLCHASHDKKLVRAIAQELTTKGARVWLDEAEILVGDSIIEKLQEGISNADYLGIVLSPKSVESIWVKKEVEAALTKEIESGKVVVIPILIEPCEIPLFIKPKKYADLTKPELWEKGIVDVVKRLAA